MTLINDTLAAKIAKAKAVGPNMSVEASKKSGGEGYVPPAAGKAVRLRLVGYFELGTHVEKTGKFAGKANKKVRLVFELSGKNWEPKEVNGTKIPQRMTMNLNYSLSTMGKFYPLSMSMRACHGDTATTMAELLGTEYIGDIEHNNVGDKVFANLVNIRKAERENDEGELVPIKVAEPITELKLFLFDLADLEMWDSIYIDGHYDERKDKDGKVTAPARSKNTLQETIMAAVNWDSCPVAALLKSGASKADAAGLDKALEDTSDVPVSGDEPDLDLI